MSFFVCIDLKISIKKKYLLFPFASSLRWTQCKSGIEWLGPGQSRQLLRDGQYGRPIQCIPIHVFYIVPYAFVYWVANTPTTNISLELTNKKITELLKSDRLIRPHKIRLFKYFFLSFEKAIWESTVLILSSRTQSSRLNEKQITLWKKNPTLSFIHPPFLQFRFRTIIA